MATVTIEAHCLDEEFIQTIKRDFNVEVVDRSKEPWSVQFSGSRESLANMLNLHWAGSDCEKPYLPDDKEIID